MLDAVVKIFDYGSRIKSYILSKRIFWMVAYKNETNGGVENVY